MPIAIANLGKTRQSVPPGIIVAVLEADDGQWFEETNMSIKSFDDTISQVETIEKEVGESPGSR